MRVTNKEINYRAMPYGHIATIPKGTIVTPAYNLPDDNLYWAKPWPNMNDREESWERNYGFLINHYETEYIEEEGLRA